MRADKGIQMVEGLSMTGSTLTAVTRFVDKIVTLGCCAPRAHMLDLAQQGSASESEESAADAARREGISLYLTAIAVFVEYAGRAGPQIMRRFREKQALPQLNLQVRERKHERARKRMRVRVGETLQYIPTTF